MGIQDEHILRPPPSALLLGSHYQITHDGPGPLPYHITDPDPKETWKHLLPTSAPNTACRDDFLYLSPQPLCELPEGKDCVCNTTPSLELPLSGNV